MRIREDFTIGHPAESVWAFLTDLQRAVDCVPGLDAAAGRLVLTAGDRSVVVIGAATAAVNRADRSITLELRGAEPGGGGRARARLEVSVEDGGLFSAVRVEGELTLGGELGGMKGTGLVAEAAHALLDRFADCAERRLGGDASAPEPKSRDPAGRSGTADAADGPPPAPGRPGWLRRLFGRIGRRD